MAGIQQSVGRGGANRTADVAIVQKLLQNFMARNNRPALRSDGQIDGATMQAIAKFQQLVLHLANPDGRVDPGGRTITALLADAGARAGPHVAAVPVALTYGGDVAPAARIVSDYAQKVIKRALTMAGMSGGVMTSTLRLPAEQAEIMYKNAAKSLAGQYNLYGGTGDLILDVYKANKTRSKAEIVAKMQKKIEDLLGQGRQVSRHVTTPARYASLNVVDIGVNSTRAVAGATFNLTGLTKAFQKLEVDGYIKKFIDETAKSNTCWHVEIVPNAKPL